MTKRHLIIATRKSPLAMQQADIIKKALETYHPHLFIELLGISTEADNSLNVSLIEMGGKGVFVKELEEALLDERADIAVHSMKDVPMDLPPGLSLPVMGRREDPRDAFVSNQYESFEQMPSGSSLGTSSLRRQTQLHFIRPDITMKSLRGNINTRLNRLDKGDFTAIILAAAGLNRLGLSGKIRSYLSIEESLPAAGQGALGIECREDDTHTQELIAPLNDMTTFNCVTAERALCRRLGGGCKVPVAAYAQIHHETLFLRGLVANGAGTILLRAELEGKVLNAEGIGVRVADELISQGASEILQEFHE